MPELDAQELQLLGYFCEARQGTRDAKHDIVPRYHAVIDSLIAKGMLEQVWVVSEAGSKALAERRADDYLAAQNK